MEHAQWMQQITEDSVRSAAKKIDVAPRTLATQLEKGRISPENVIAIAVAYDHHPVGALVDTGYLDAKWAEQVDPARALRSVTEKQLADEVLRRMELGVEHGGALDTPVDELASRRTNGGTRSEVPSYDGTVREWDDTTLHAADSSPDEQAERERRGENLFD
ncbi:hypothetical protein [Corynebacterium pseudopelargi]|nr:hypothetical protein [Corynebacterium pseudopelargi]